MIVALQLAPNNRFLLRSATRLYIHSEEYDRAHDLLLRAEATAFDPWLIAAELAVAPIASKPPEYVFEARRLLSARDYSPFHLTELAGALATLELASGKSKISKKLFQVSLRDPTENSIAQASWAAQQMGILLEVNEQLLTTPRLYEAQAVGSWHSGDWLTSASKSDAWLDDQPFSSRPAIHGSFVSIMFLDQDERGAEFARCQGRSESFPLGRRKRGPPLS